MISQLLVIQHDLRRWTGACCQINTKPLRDPVEGNMDHETTLQNLRTIKYGIRVWYCTSHADVSTTETGFIIGFCHTSQVKQWEMARNIPRNTRIAPQVHLAKYLGTNYSEYRIYQEQYDIFRNEFRCKRNIWSLIVIWHPPWYPRLCQYVL